MGDHFSPITYLYVPFYYLFGSYTLLLIQIASILLGGYGIYTYFRYKFPGTYIPAIILFYFFSIWGIFAALSFDFHNNVIAAMLVPWLVYFYEVNRKKSFLICFLLILLSKENMALWLGFIMLGLMLKNGIRNYKTYLRFEFPLFLLALAYFFVVISYVMPPLQNLHSNYQFNRYPDLGSSPAAMIETILTHPLHTLSLFFKNTSTTLTLNTKFELHIVVLASGGLALLFRPYYLLMLLPIYIQKMLTNDTGLWGMDGQYSIEFVPILALAVADTLSAFHSEKIRTYVSAVTAILALATTIYLLDHQEIGGNARFYKASHYQSELSTFAIYDALKLIPEDAPVSASSPLTPHLAARDKIYAFPNILDAQYIALLDAKVRSTYPISESDYTREKDSLKNSGSFDILYDKNQLLILKRK